MTTSNRDEGPSGTYGSAKRIVKDAAGLLLTVGPKKIAAAQSTLAKGLSRSTALASATGKSIQEYVSAAYEAAAKSKRKVVNDCAVLANAILASDFVQAADRWLGSTFNEGVPSIYDKAVDAVYSTTHVGGGNLHRLFDGSHTLWGMWHKVREASPDDNLLQETVGYASALSKDLASPVGIPLFDLSKASYDELAGFLTTTFGIPRAWVADMLHVNATELIGTSISVIAVALNWKTEDTSQFGRLAGSLGISAVASANPALAVVALVTLSRAYVQARQTADYSHAVNGLAQGGVGTGAFLATASIIGGPAWIGILAGVCVAGAVHHATKRVELSEITRFVGVSFRNAFPEQFGPAIARRVGLKPFV